MFYSISESSLDLCWFVSQGEKCILLSNDTSENWVPHPILIFNPWNKFCSKIITRKRPRMSASYNPYDCLYISSFHYIQSGNPISSSDTTHLSESVISWKHWRNYYSFLVKSNFNPIENPTRLENEEIWGIILQPERLEQYYWLECVHPFTSHPLTHH